MRGRTGEGWSTTRRWVLFALVATAAALYLSSLGHRAPKTTRQANLSGHVSYDLTCCGAADLNRVLYPGAIAAFHWEASPAALPSTRPSFVTLSMQMLGPFPNVEVLKYSIAKFQGLARGLPVPKGLAIVKPRLDLSAQTVRTTTWSAAAPEMRIPVPPDAPAGWYALNCTTVSGGGSISFGSMVRVAQPGT